MVFLGILPSVLLFLPKIDFGSFKRFLANIGASLGIIIIIAFANMSNWPWVDRHGSPLGSLLMPWSYTVNSVRYKCAVRERNRQEIPLPDVTYLDDEKDVVVLVIGESARRDHFSLYGYPRETNPLLAKTMSRPLSPNPLPLIRQPGSKPFLIMRLPTSYTRFCRIISTVPVPTWYGVQAIGEKHLCI